MQSARPLQSYGKIGDWKQSNRISSSRRKNPSKRIGKQADQNKTLEEEP